MRRPLRKCSREEVTEREYSANGISAIITPDALWTRVFRNRSFSTVAAWHNQVTRLTAQTYLRPVCEEAIDTLVLGCTHYPLLEGIIREITGDGVFLVNSAKETAKEVKRVLEEEGINTPKEQAGSYIFYVTDNVERFIHVGERFLGRELGSVKEIG